MQRSTNHRSMMREFKQLSHSISSKEAAKQVVCKNRKLFEELIEEGHIDEESL